MFVSFIGIFLLRIYRQILHAVYYFVNLYREKNPVKLHNTIRRAYVWRYKTQEKIPVIIPESDKESVSLATLWHLAREASPDRNDSLVVHADINWVVGFGCSPDSLMYYLRFNTPYPQCAPMCADCEISYPEGVVADISKYLGYNDKWNIYPELPWMHVPEIFDAMENTVGNNAGKFTGPVRVTIDGIFVTSEIELPGYTT